MVDEIFKLSTEVMFNPRNLKRIVNLLQLMNEIGKIRPIDENDPLSPKLDKWGFGQGYHWRIFCEKTVVWIFLCQNYLFRMTLFLQILLDFDQKREFNSSLEPGGSGSPFKYQRTDSSHLNHCHLKNQEHQEPPSVDDITIKDFYMDHVDRYVHAFRKSNKLARRDKDPEQFYILLQFTLKVGSSGKPITCADVLGPTYLSYLSDSNMSGLRNVNDRNTHFALKSFSFMDPALSLEVFCRLIEFIFLLLIFFLIIISKFLINYRIFK